MTVLVRRVLFMKIALNWKMKITLRHLPADAIGVFAIVPLCAVVYVVKHDNAGYEVHRLPRWKEVQVGPAIPPPVTISGIIGSR